MAGLEEVSSTETAQYAALRATLDSLASTSSEYMSSALKQLMENDEIKAHIKQGIMPYIYAAGLLSFAGREITEENLSKLVKAIGIVPNEYLMDVLLKTGIKSHLVYVYAFYYLVASSVGVSTEKMEEVVEALGVQSDMQIAEEMRQLCMKMFETQ